MPTDQKIDEVLEIVREHSAQFQKQGAQINELFQLFLEERKLNNDRFTQLATGFRDVKQELSEMNVGMNSLNTKIDKVYDSLSQDIQVFGEDLRQVKRRVGRLEKKLLS
jgi:uncharacterized coiled-coil DUF342 family protein